MQAGAETPVRRAWKALESFRAVAVFRKKASGSSYDLTLKQSYFPGGRKLGVFFEAASISS